MLIDSMQRKFMGYCLQDLSCSKCREVTQYNMAKRCKCAGDFETTVKVDTTAQLLKAFLGLARHYQMPLLHEQVTWMFKMNPKLAKRMDIDITDDAPE